MTAVDMQQVRRLPVGYWVGGGLLVIVALMFVSVTVGPLNISYAKVVDIFSHQMGFAHHGDISARDITVVWLLRTPRTFLALVVGASLAISGAALQSLFNNPLADPGVVGVTAGASAGAVATIVLASTAGVFSDWLVPIGAFVCGLATTILIYLLARPGRNHGTARMLLVGIAVGAGAHAIVGFFTYLADETELQSLVFWQMGSLSKVTWSHLVAVVPLFVVGTVAIFLLARTLDVLTLGEREAFHLGLNVKRARLAVIFTSAILTASAVAFAGSIGFVGLVVPHIMRFIVGPMHKVLLPASAVSGGILILVADILSRTLNPPSEVPIGLFTAVIGAPFFLFLVMRERGRVW